MKIIEKIYDVVDQSEKIVEKEMNQDEIDALTLENAKLTKLAELREKAEFEKTALLMKLGLTTDEAKLLLS